jgi:carboxymethylenebutenolidase
MARIDVPSFLARPSAEISAGIVVIHEGNGISKQLLRLCERLAGEGFAVVAPDLFFRSGGPSDEDYLAQVQALTTEEVLEDLGSARRQLVGLGAAQVGVMGFCMGGTLSWQAATHQAGFAAAVGFYGSGIASELGEPSCPTLLFFGGSDPYIPAADIEAVAAHHAETTVYPAAGHGFMRDGSDDHDPVAAADAWERTLRHFHQHLG